MKKLTKENLESMVRQVIEDLPGKIYDNFIIYDLATATLRHYLGDEWTNQNASAFFEPKVLKGNGKGRNFLRTGDPIAENHFRHQLRVMQLAELMFNLQGVDGIEERIEKIKQGALESFYGELECAAQIKKANLPFRFVIPSGNRGKDYDIEIMLSSGGKLNCEMEVTTEEKDLRQSTILNKLKGAKKQLPKEQPGMIFLKIPESWPKQSDAQTILNESLNKFLGDTNRVIAVVLRWEELIVDLSILRPAVLKIFFRIEANTSSKFYSPEIENILWQINNPLLKDWIRFPDIVKQMSI